MQLTPGVRLGRYEIVARLGVGGMGEVWKARDTRLTRTVAIKVLPVRNADDPEYRHRLLREARAASALNHPGIVTIYDVVSEGGLESIVMEFVEGRTLQAAIKQESTGGRSIRVWNPDRRRARRRPRSWNYPL